MKTASQESSIVIRDIRAAEEMREVEQIQKIVWGVDDLDVVPAAQLIASKTAGGVLLGAFHESQMAGFVFGFVGWENGTAIHHSHMLAIRPEFRHFNFGIKLKLAQRECVIKQGIAEMTWTFDPLQSQNAYINFNKLGVVSKRYLVNFYGEDATSFLHRNDTDRLWVSWLLKSRRVRDRLADGISESAIEGAVPLIEVESGDTPRSYDFESCAKNEKLSIEIPGDINYLQERDTDLAFDWRLATRSAFTRAIEADFLVEEFFRRKAGGKPTGVYILSRGKGLGDFD